MKILVTGAAETMGLAAFVDQLQLRPRKSLGRLRYRARLGYTDSDPRRQNGNSGLMILDQ